MIRKNDKIYEKEKRNQKRVFIILLLGIVFLTFSFGIFGITKKMKPVSILIEEETIKKWEEPFSKETIEIEKIIEENTKKIKKQEIQEEETDLEYTTKYLANHELPQGQMQVIQEGRDGKQKQITTTTYEGEETKKEVKNIILVSSVDKIIEIGSAPYTNDYQIKVGEEVYVTSQTLALRESMQETSRKIITLAKNNKVKVEDIQGDWYQVTYQYNTGWAKANCFTNINPQTGYIPKGYSKEQLLARLSPNMNLNKPSDFTLEQFKKVLTKDSNDKNGVFHKNAEYFYYIEKQYEINGIIVAAIGIHESAWGTSKISLDKKNLFGYGAYDSSPYESSYRFASYEQGIDLIARVLKKYYITPPNTTIYDGQKASGSHYYGNTLKAVNTDYATDKNWANAVYNWMKYLYQKL